MAHISTTLHIIERPVQQMLTSIQKMRSAPYTVFASGTIGLRAAWRTLRDACRRWWQAERTRAELGALSDVDLRDVGLTRGDIDAAAKGMFTR